MGTRFNSIAQSVARYRKYHETLNELDRMGERELADLGLSRADFQRIARQAVYGG